MNMKNLVILVMVLISALAVMPFSYAMLDARCQDPSYLTDQSDLVVEATADKVEVKSQDINGGKTIDTFQTVKISKFIKGTGDNIITIVTPGGCIAGMCEEVEDSGPVMTEGKSYTLYLRKNGDYYYYVCSDSSIEEISTTTKPVISVPPTVKTPVEDTGLTEVACGECMVYEPVACDGGKMIPGKKDECGCTGPPKCIIPGTPESTSTTQITPAVSTKPVVATEIGKDKPQPTMAIAPTESTKSFTIDPAQSSVSVKDNDAKETKVEKVGFKAIASVSEGSSMKEISITASGEKVMIASGGLRLMDCIMYKNDCNNGVEAACAKYQYNCEPRELYPSVEPSATSSGTSVGNCMKIKLDCDKGTQESCTKFSSVCSSKLEEEMVPPSVVSTSEKVEIRENKLYMNDMEVKVMPDTASQKAISVLALNKNISIELKDTGKPVYEVTGKKEAKVFAVFKTEMSVTAYVNGDTGAVSNVKKPWWAFIATEG